jgi:hypothetical protein
MRYIVIACLIALGITAFGGDAERGSKTGLVAHYYKDHKYWKGHWPDTVSIPDVDPKHWTFTEYKYSRVEPLVNHLFARKGWFTVRWVGYLDTSPRTVEKDGKQEYKFEIFADDGCRLFIDGKMIIDDWKACWEKTPEAHRKSMSIKLLPGKHRIVVEYFQGQSLKSHDRDPMKLYWSCASRGIPKQIIPASHLSHTEEDKKSTSR